MQESGDDACNMQISVVLAAHISGASWDSWNSSHGSPTELDSHANMPVAGCGMRVVSTTGCHTTLVPFSGISPSMEKVKIADVVMAFDNPKLYVYFGDAECVVHPGDGTQLNSTVSLAGGRPPCRQNAKVSIG